MKAWIYGTQARILDAFNSWFVSDQGVWHTFLVTITIVVCEEMFSNLDPHGFWLLYWLTVYSAVTQPALARAGRVGTEEQTRLLTEQNALLLQILAGEKSIQDFIEQHGGA